MNIKELRHRANLSQQKMSDLTGITKGKIAQWEAGNGNPKVNDHATLVKFFSEKLNIPENMVSSLGTTEQIESAVNITKTAGETVFTVLGGGYTRVETPLVPHRAYAGYAASWSDEHTPSLSELDKFTVTMKDPTIGEYLSFEVQGDSMDDGSKNSIEEGAIVTGRKLDQKYWTSRLHLHKYQYYVFVTTDGIIIKEAIDHFPEKGIVVCRSLNLDKNRYPDFELHLSQVKEIFYIRAVTNIKGW